MLLRILLLILSFSITLCLASCAKVIKVDIQEVGEKSFVIRAHDAFWRKRVCIDFVSIQKGADIFWIARKDRKSRVCADSIHYPNVPLGFQVGKSLTISRPGIYGVSVFSDAGDGSAKLDLK
jgi:hypothetical protein